MTIGDIIKDFREQRQMSMDEFGQLAGMSKSYVFALEKNEHPRTKEPINPSLGIISRVSTATGYSIEEIYARLGSGDCFGVRPSFSMSDLEMRLIDRFRASDDLEKAMVLKILGLEDLGKKEVEKIG